MNHHFLTVSNKLLKSTYDGKKGAEVQHQSFRLSAALWSLRYRQEVITQAWQAQNEIFGAAKLSAFSWQLQGIHF